MFFCVLLKGRACVLGSNGGISKWRCGFHKYWPIGTECSRIFDSHEAIGRHTKWGCGDFHAKCPHNGCDQRGQVKWLFAEHIPSCENQFNSAEPCGDCGVFLDARDEQGLHGYVCKERVARCPMCEAYFSKR